MIGYLTCNLIGAFLSYSLCVTSVQVLLENATPEQSEEMLTAYDMLTNDEKMGKRFKMFAISRKGQIPVPF